ncbi:MAG: tetratricopeptide repeat protein [Candidatus Aminicenantales bacterium]
MARQTTSPPKVHRSLIYFFLLSLILTLFCALPGAGQIQTGQEDPESLLVRADDFYSKGEYKKAVEDYLQVINLTENRLLRSRAWMGLSLCYFFDNEIENAKNALRRLLEIEPQKEISPLFYPQTFVDLFSDVKKEFGEKVKPEQPVVPPVTAPAQEKPLPPVVPLYKERKGGHWELEVHYSGWSIDPAKSLFESSLTKKVTNEVRDHLTDQLRGIYGSSLAPSSYTSKLTLDSQGSNYGLEIRFYPLGYRGSFSLGLSIEKTHIKIPVEGEVTQKYADGSEAVVKSNAYIDTSPFTTNLSFRWDFMPSWRVTPYFIFGLGVGPLAGEAKYEYTGTYRRGSEQRAIEGGETKSFDDLREEGDIELDLFLLLHTALGIKGEIISGLTAKAEIGFWDGLVLKAGLAFRY